MIERLGIGDMAAERIAILFDNAARIAAKLREGSPAEWVRRSGCWSSASCSTLTGWRSPCGAPPLCPSPSAGVAEPIRLAVPLQLRRRGVEMKLLIPQGTHDRQRAHPDPSLIKAVARGHRWFEDLATGRAASLRDIAAGEGISEGYVGRLIQLAFLAPSIVEAILDGTQPVDLTAARLTGGPQLRVSVRCEFRCR